MIVVTIAAVISAGIATTINPAASARLHHRPGATVSADGRRCGHRRAGTGDAGRGRRPIAAVAADTAAIVGFILGQACGRRRHGKNQGQRYRRTHYLWTDHCRLLSLDTPNALLEADVPEPRTHRARPDST